jgi:adenosine deaminase
VDVNAEFLTGMPKAELHVHLEGTLEPEMMLRTARANRVDLPWRSVEEVREAYRFSSLEDFLAERTCCVAKCSSVHRLSSILASQPPISSRVYSRQSTTAELSGASTVK